MGHYFYINQVDIKGKNISNSDNIVEWKMEIPPMFFPLFVGKPKYIENLLYTPAEEGFELFKKMYDFLENHKEKVFDKPEEFSMIKEKILETVEPINGFYELNGSDVFLMTCSEEDELLEESQKCYALMNEVNKEIIEAIEKDDIDAFLNIYTDHTITHCSESLRYFFTHKEYKYGYAPIDFYNDPLNPKTEPDTIEIYTENDKKGLKKGSTIILSPTYDEIWGFEANTGLAVVKTNEKFGYINENGELIIPLMYDDAYDFEMQTTQNQYNSKLGKYIRYGENRALITLAGKEGIINEKNEMIVQPEWDRIIIHYFYTQFLYDQMLIFAKKEGKYCILDVHGKEKYPLTIDDFYIGKKEEEEEEKEEKNNEPIPGFATRLWINDGEKTFYLNNNLKPFAENLTIINKGDAIYMLDKKDKNRKFNCLNYIVKNQTGQVGLISSENSIRIPIIYEDLKSEKYEEYFYETFYFGLINNEETIYVNDRKNNVRELGKFPKSKAAIFGLNVYEDYAIKVKTAKGLNLYSAKTQDYLFKEPYIYIDNVSFQYKGTHDSFIIASKENKVDVFYKYNLEKIELSITIIDTLLNTSWLKKHYPILNEVKKQFINQHLSEIFPDPEQQKLALDFFPNVNFDSTEEIANAIKLADENIELSQILIKNRLLFDAFAYHFEKSDKKGFIINQYGAFHYDIATLYFNNENYLEATVWCEKAIEILPELDKVRVYAMNLSCRAFFLDEKYDDCIQIGTRGLELIEILRNKASKGLLWAVSNTKKYLEELLDNEEVIHFFLGKSYYFKAETENLNSEIYANAKIHIEVSIKMSDWELYEKKHYYALCIYRSSSNVFDSLPALEEFINFAKDYEAGYDLFYTKYVYAHTLNKKGDKKRALEIIEEVLQLDPENSDCLELKEEINKNKGFWDSLFK